MASYPPRDLQTRMLLYIAASALPPSAEEGDADQGATSGDAPSCHTMDPSGSEPIANGSSSSHDDKVKPTTIHSAPSSENAVGSQSNEEADVNISLASQFASASVTSSLSDQLERETFSSSRTHPSVFVSDLPEVSGRQPPLRQVIVRDIVDLGNGQSVMVPNERDLQALAEDRTGHKRSAGETDNICTERAPSPKKQKIVKQEESVAEAREREEAAEQLMNTITKYQQSILTSEVIQQIRSLSRETIRYVHTNFALQLELDRSGKNQAQSNLAHSDEESDEERIPNGTLTSAPSKFQLTSEQRLIRLLIFGGVSHAQVVEADPERLSITQSINTMIDEGEGEQAVRALKDISVRGRSFRQGSLLFALARCCRCSDKATKSAAYAAIQDICRIPTDLFQLIKYIESTGESSGWGRGLRTAVNKWYNKNASDPLHLAMHVTKYRNRHGWNHRDVLKLSHIKPVNDSIGFIVRYVTRGMKDAEEDYLEDGYLERAELEKVHRYLKAVEESKRCQDIARSVELVRDYNLVREQLATQMLNQPEIWSALMPAMPLNALLRNLNKMTALGLFSHPEEVQTVLSKLQNTSAMRSARVHPLRLLLAHRMYKQGSGERGRLTWKPVTEIVDGLEKAFYASFELVEPSNKRILIALDISYSMTQRLRDLPISVREAATVMAMVTIRTEPRCDIVGFHHHLMPLDMFRNPSKTLDQLMEETSGLGFGFTDCSKPMVWARKHRKEYDAFVMYTDCETNSNRIPPFKALDRYRTDMNIPNAKLVVVAMTSSNFSIARPDDIYMLDVVGFDTDTPEMIREFLAGGVE